MRNRETEVESSDDVDDDEDEDRIKPSEFLKLLRALSKEENVKEEQEPQRHKHQEKVE